MAFFNCRKCGKEYDFTLLNCPHCGGQTKRTISTKFILGIIIAIFIVGIMGELNRDKSTNSNYEYDYRSEAIYASRDLMEQRLKAPATADFQSTSEAKYQTYQENGEQLYTVTSYVDAQNSFGANIRTHYAITMRHSGTMWYLVDINTW